MLTKRMQYLKKEKDRGVSLVIVLCVSAFFVAFAAALLYTAGLLTAQSTARLSQERLYLLAKSYSEVLNQELITPTEKQAETGGNASFYAFVNAFLDNSQYADDVVYDFVLTEESQAQDVIKNGGYGELRVSLTRIQNGEDGANTLEGTLDANESNYSGAIASLQNTTVRQYLVQVDVTATLDGDSYTYSTEYTREEKYSLSFSHNGYTIVWDGNGWHIGNTSGQAYTPNPEDGKITYKFDKSQTTSCRFIENTFDADYTSTTTTNE